MTNKRPGDGANGPRGAGPRLRPWQIRILGFQRPGRRPERHDRTLSVDAETLTAAASQGVVTMLREAQEAGRPLEPGTRFQACVGSAGDGSEFRLIVTYEPRPPSGTQTAVEPAPTPTGLEAPGEEADYYVRVRTQQHDDGPRVPLEWDNDERARSPEDAACRAVETLRARMPGLGDPDARRTVYAVDAIRRGDRHRPFEGWEIEVTVDGRGTAAPGGGTTTVH